MAGHDVDLFVIGGGSGGVRAARIAATHGAKVAIAEEYRYGGTCVIRGCVPKKLLVYASRFPDDFEEAAGFGWTVGASTFDWPTLIANKDREIARLEGLYKSNLMAKGVTTYDQRARVDGANAVRLADGRRITAAKILVATGGRTASDPTIAGHEHAISSNEAFHLEQKPRRIVVVGGGYIALEFASIFAGLGSEVTLIYRGEKVLRGFDEDLRDGAMAALGERGIRMVMMGQLKRIEKTASGLVGTLASGKTIAADTVMLAIGRVPNTSDLGLETAGVATGARGEIKVDSWSQSSVPSIYAVGDVTDRANLTPVAIREGHAFADAAFGTKRVAVDHSLIPTAVFTTPEIATVGLSEQAARAAGHALDIYKSRFRPMRATLGGRGERMLMKLVVDAASDRVLGVHVLGPDAAEIVQMAAIALTLKATKADFDATMALHPSAAEELVTMREKWQPPKA
jgi:glutathione reductase (NADPH)